MAILTPEFIVVGTSIIVGSDEDWRLQRTGAKAVTVDDGAGGPATLSIPGTGSNSEQFGAGATASGGDSLAIGFSANATKTNNIAIGTNASAIVGLHAIAIGSGASCDVGLSVAIGKDSSVGTFGTSYCTAVGALALASQNATTAIGGSAQATGNSSVAIGALTEAQVSSGIAIGTSALARAGGGAIAIGAQSEAIGIAIGFQAEALSLGGVAIGQSSTSSAQAVSVGNNAASSGTNAISVGINAAAARNGIALGAYAEAGFGGVGQTSIALGPEAVCTAVAQMVVGSPFYPIADIHLGEGPQSATPSSCTLHSTAGVGTDINGADLILSPGEGTGAGDPGDFIVRTSDVLGSGTTVQTLATRLTISDTDATLTVPLTAPNISKISNGTAITATDTAAAGERMLYDPTGCTFQINAPASPVMGTRWATKNRSADLTSITISGNGSNIENPTASFSLAATFLLSGDGISVEWEYDGTQWVVV